MYRTIVQAPALHTGQARTTESTKQKKDMTARGNREATPYPCGGCNPQLLSSNPASKWLLQMMCMVVTDVGSAPPSYGATEAPKTHETGSSRCSSIFSCCPLKFQVLLTCAPVETLRCSRIHPRFVWLCLVRQALKALLLFGFFIIKIILNLINELVNHFET